MQHNLFLYFNPITPSLKKKTIKENNRLLTRNKHIYKKFMDKKLIEKTHKCATAPPVYHHKAQHS